MTFPEVQPSLTIEQAGQRHDGALPRSEVAKIIAVTQSQYPFKDYLPKDVDMGLNLPTAIAAMHAIDAKGQEQGWEIQDLLAAVPVTRAALTAAGFANAKEGVQALLTGTTGELSNILKTILPQDAPKGVRGIAKTMIRVNAVDNMRVVTQLLIDEKHLEARLLRLISVQEEILVDPGKTRALLEKLNCTYQGSGSTGTAEFPQEAKTHLERISPFSLEDMKAVNGLFDAFEGSRNSDIQIETQSLKLETEKKKLRAAGLNVAKVFSGLLEIGVESTLLIAGGGIVAIVGGGMLSFVEGRSVFDKANETLKRKNEERKAAKIQ